MKFRKDTSHRKCCGLLIFVSIELNTTSGKCSIKLSGQQHSDVENLSSDHEEADTRILLHAKHASSSFGKIILCSPDTDVAIIDLGHMDSFEHCEVLFLTGKGKTKRMVDLKKIQTSLTSGLCKALIGLHSFTGCDSTSAFYGKGKIRALKIVSQNQEFIDSFQNFGNDFSISEESDTFKALEKVVCKLYAQDITSVNSARYRLFCRSSATEENSPPTKSALLHHAKRPCYQAAVHKSSLSVY